uniref:Fission protein ELM1 n=1 Tax=Candidatus Kentrum sp. LPFa TaxID=2126335 RepID=A0A450XTR8_9GAMM|nr:MAG: hypothetical protein BECKLPF1236A_GA0070988_101758 [Candidatus Kentron sp. LPFa]VFK32638.1 MAG: hypothetical protein BECKLPF1236C_GA0070990_101748 [Candidatus Kentron sp. LPFa]
MTIRPIIAWRFRDGKRGHESQSQGLLQALGQLLPIKSFDITLDITTAPGVLRPFNALFWHSFRTKTLPRPDLLIGAGHKTHLPLLANARMRGGRAIVLMKPTLPIRWFDLCVIPAHDGVGPRGNVLTTRGVLNPIARNPDKRPDRGFFLIGGSSRHYGWDEDTLFEQIDTIVARTPGMTWIATTSRRTPESTARNLMGRNWENLRPILGSDTPEGWLPEQLARARTVWATEDSVSMIYEALTSGASTGLLSVPRHAVSRLSLGVDSLVTDNLVTTFPAWHQQAVSQSSRSESPGESGVYPGEFNEAARCAQWIVDQWFANP